LICDLYSGISGLNINVQKLTAPFTNSMPKMIQGLQRKGLNTPEAVRHLGIELDMTIGNTLSEALRIIDLKL
jgi:hypothetical protein